MENRCVCCGEIIPEGRLVCMLCEIMAGSENDLINRRRSYGDIRSGQRELRNENEQLNKENGMLQQEVRNWRKKWERRNR